TVESVAHVIFELRRVVGSPGAAAFDFDGSTNAATQLSSASTGGPWTPKSWATVHGSGEAVEPAHGATGDDLGNPGSGLSPRPPPGAMVTGFLKHMSQRWKAHLDWGVADLVAPRRASPRLERSRGRRRCVFYDESEDGIGQRGGCGIGGADIPQGLRDETIDLFGGLRGELLRAERLAVLALLRGPVSTRTSRLWVVRAALAASRTVSALATDSDLAFAAHSGRQIGEGRPYTAGAAVSNDGGSGGEEPETGSGSARIAVAAAAGDNASANAIIKWPLRSRGRRSAADGRRAGQCQGSEGYVSGSGNDGGNPSDSHGGVVEGDGDCCRTGEGREREEEELGEGLGMLCRHTALELREALENGLSVKLTQAYLDQIELFGNAALEHRRRAKG
ncbi:unnamed protein product, partial [Sphacelaria rigidula]